MLSLYILPYIPRHPAARAHTHTHTNEKEKQKTKHTALLPCVMVNFMCQLYWDTEYPDIGLNIIYECVCEGVSG